MKQPTMDRRTFMTAMLPAAQLALSESRVPGGADAAEFRDPPASARPWVFWFWINGNISKEGITADLEALKRVGVGGVLWMEVSGPWWAPDGDVVPLSPRWHEAFQWAVRECRRLGLQFDVTLDFGYGSGGPHITPDLSMQQLIWSETEVTGGRRVVMGLEKAPVQRNVSAWLRPGAKINAELTGLLERFDSYKDVAVIAIPLPAQESDRAFRIAEIKKKSGLDWNPPPSAGPAAMALGSAATPPERVLDLTAHMKRDGQLTWEAPAGDWLILRFGQASNYKMTRPSPAAAVGLECDRLAKAGIETHYRALLKKLFDDAGAAAGPTLSFVHIDSWEAGCQNWTATFPDEFRRRRGYELRPWLPVMTGRVIASAELSERFLWDVRTTVSEMIRDNYAGRLRELAREHGIKLSIEAYGHLSIDNLSYGGLSDMPISEFWARGKGQFPTPNPKDLYENSSKAMASAAHTYGRAVTGAESFTGDRGWQDHPFLLKPMGDKAFCRGINRFILHLSAHQARNDMIPGLTHRRWGEHFQRHNTWWEYSKPWFDYLTRCQYLLQQGIPVADVCYWFGEGAPLNVTYMDFSVPEGYDYDLCSAQNVLQMKVSGGRLVLPSGASYRYLVLPDADRMTAPLARKIQELVEAGARVIGRRKPIGPCGLGGYPGSDSEVARIGEWLWESGRVVTGKSLDEILRQDGLAPDFEGEALEYIHRRIGESEVYFVSHQGIHPIDRTGAFRVSGKVPELWDPETGETREARGYSEHDGRISVPLHFEPAQSWFVVFRPGKSAHASRVETNFVAPRPLRQIDGKWQVSFDARWGGPEQPVLFEKLTDWSQHADPRIHYYSGTATYRNTLVLTPKELEGRQGRLVLDLGALEVMARVRLNGRECGVAWKPPYLIDVTKAGRAGTNELEIDVVNLWINRMIGDEQLPEDSNWKDFETLLEWPEWFRNGKRRPSGRYTFTSCKHYTKDSPLVPAGLLGPVTLKLAGGA